MRRREFLKGVSGAAAWPLSAWAQQPAMPMIGFLHGGSHDPYIPYTAIFRQGLNENGFIEGRSVAIEYRWAEDRYDRLPALSEDLVARGVSVIVAWGPLAARAAKTATAAIPIVFLTGGDPVQEGLVESLSRPSGNVTGVSFLVNLLLTKRLQLLHELVPGETSIAVLLNPSSPVVEADTEELMAAARSLGIRLNVLKVSTDRELSSSFSTLVQQRAGALLIGTDPFFTDRRDQLVSLATRHAIPTIYFLRESVEAGGLMSYGASLGDAYHHVGLYVARVLSGSKPADLPIPQSVKIELAINLKVAKAVGLEVPSTILLRADEVIE
jgi:putative tryptophan/tyrosine transport system substrate-binding protein